MTLDHMQVKCKNRATAAEVSTIMGKTTAAGETLMTQSSTKQVSCTRVKMWTFHSGT